MKNWNDFLQEFVLQAMTRAEVTSASDEAYYLRVSIRMAREAWDAIQAAELPESEKAKQAPAPSFVSTAGLAPIAANSPDLKPSNSTELKALARTAREVVDAELQWIGIDLNGQVWAYDLKPLIYEPGRCWDNSADGGYSWEIGAVAPPDNFRDELYEINKLLKDENE